MASSPHAIIGGVLVAVILVASATGLIIAGGPGEARKQKEDGVRLQAVEKTALALVCYQREFGSIPEDMSAVEAELSRAESGVRSRKGCDFAALVPDPVSGEHFRLVREGGRVTQICATFAAASSYDRDNYAGIGHRVVPQLYDARTSAGEQCFGLNMTADLE